MAACEDSIERRSRYAALEKQHEQNRRTYYRSLRSLQAQNYYDIPLGQDIRSWVVYWLGCLIGAYSEALTRVADVVPVAESHYPHAQEHRLGRADAMFRRHRKLRASEYAELAGLGRTQAVSDLNALVSAGVLERSGGGRSTIYRLCAARKTSQS